MSAQSAALVLGSCPCLPRSWSRCSLRHKGATSEAAVGVPTSAATRPPGAGGRDCGNVVSVARPSLFEFAGGQPAFLALATAHHARCLEDPVLRHPFSHPGHPRHVERLANYWAEVFGGPPLFSQASEGQTGMLALHAGMEAQDDMGDRFVGLFRARPGRRPPSRRRRVPSRGARVHGMGRARGARLQPPRLFRSGGTGASAVVLGRPGRRADGQVETAGCLS